MTHQNPPHLAFCTPGQNKIKKQSKGRIQRHQRETNRHKNIYIFLNESQGIKGMGNIQHIKS